MKLFPMLAVLFAVAMPAKANDLKMFCLEIVENNTTPDNAFIYHYKFVDGWVSDSVLTHMEIGVRTRPRQYFNFTSDYGGWMDVCRESEKLSTRKLGNDAAFASCKDKNNGIVYEVYFHGTMGRVESYDEKRNLLWEADYCSFDRDKLLRKGKICKCTLSDVNVGICK